MRGSQARKGKNRHTVPTAERRRNKSNTDNKIKKSLFRKTGRSADHRDTTALTNTKDSGVKQNGKRKRNDHNDGRGAGRDERERRSGLSWDLQGERVHTDAQSGIPDGPHRIQNDGGTWQVPGMAG